MPWFLGRFWKSLLVISGVIGVIAIPKDVQDRGDMLAPYQRVVAMFNQNTALWLLVTLLAGWIVWTDLRPYIRKWRARPPALLIERGIYAESRHVVDSKGNRVSDLYHVTFCIVVRNNRPDQKTLRNVSASYSLIGEPRRLRCRSGNGATCDLRHGEVALFELGESISGEHVGVPRIKKELSTPDIVRAKAAVKEGHGSIEIGADQPDPIRIGFPAELELSDLAGTVIVAADDEEAAAMSVRIDTRQLPNMSAAFELKAA